ncbi:MAG: CoA ester lyase [Moraxella sp.]|nr:CoA ester lyase [Moraxella sp.]
MLAKSFLFVPADRPERLSKAVATGVGAVIIDLEDAVAGSNKAGVRGGLDGVLSKWDWQAFGQIWVRVNGADSPEFGADMAWLKGVPNIAGVFLPKVQSKDDVQALTTHTDKPIIAMIESPKGLLNLPTIAQVKGLSALSYGVLDFLLPMGVQVDSLAGVIIKDKIRTELILCSSAYGLSAPIESIYPDFRDEAGLVAYIRHWQGFGFGGQLFIHPKQVATFLAVQQDAQRLAFAKKVLDHHHATGQAVFAIDGQMVDLPVIEWARGLLAHAYE